MEVLTPRPTGEGQKTLFVTFYSFKGGVGRTLALLNVACILAGLGRRVLMIDFDLEAPGLTLFQDKQREEGASRKQPGLVDAIGDFLDDPWSSPVGDAEPSGFFDDYVSSLDVPEGVQKKEKEGVLNLVPAGRLDDEYENHLYDLDLEKMFEEGVGRPFFERLKDLIEDSGRYDYILVDSRTGFSDEGSISTRFLGDYLMVLTGLNRQNVRGTARFLRQSNVAERDETLALVASPVPMYYEDLRAERIDAAKEHIAERAGLEEVQFVTQIPYHPVLALEEDPTVRSLEGTDLFESYEEITERLQSWAGDRPEERIQEVSDLLRRGELREALSIFREVRDENPEVVLQFLRHTKHALSEDYPNAAVNLLEEGIAVAEEVNDPQAKKDLLTDLVEGYIRVGDADQLNSIDDTFEVSVSLLKLGNRYSMRSETHRAIDRYERALRLTEEMGYRYGEAGLLNNLGNLHIDIGNIDKAISLYENSLFIFRDINDKSGEALPLTGLGSCYYYLGDLRRSLEYYKDSLDLRKEAENRSESLSLHLTGNCYASLGDLNQALSYLKEALILSRKNGNREREVDVLGSISRRRAQLGEKKKPLEDVSRALEITSNLENKKLIAGLHFDRAFLLSHFDSQQALDTLQEQWSFIQEYRNAFEKVEAHVLRARLRLEVENDAEGAAEDAQNALDFYRERNVDSRWSREAEEILEKAQAHDG